LVISLEKYIKNGDSKMKKEKWWIIFFIPVFLFAVDNQKLFECYQIFSQKKSELESEAQNLIERQEAFESLKNTYMALMKKKEKELNKKESEINATLQKIENEKKQIQNLLAKNRQILQDIKNAKMNKIVQSYAKMKAKNSALILENMKTKDAINILQKLSPRTLAKIFSKMDPNKAASYTQILEGENNQSSNTSKP